MIRNFTSADYDVIVVGAGIGGIYGVHKLCQMGLSVLGLEAGAGVGGVWYHNRYPGARVDLESADFCYHFSPELFRDWRWTERYASQNELSRYLGHVADRFGVRERFRFNTQVVAAHWIPERHVYAVTTSAGDRVRCRFLVMATGALSLPRKPDFPGLSEFQGQLVLTSRWPDHPVEWAGRRVAVVGTGSSGVQTIPVVAEAAERLYVFQRTPSYSVPVRNGPPDERQWKEICSDVTAARDYLFTLPTATRTAQAERAAADLSEADRIRLMERLWMRGGQGFKAIFSDQGTNKVANDYVAEFVRTKIREIVNDPKIAELLSPRGYPICSPRLCLGSGYYETYNRENVTLIDLRSEPIQQITRTGIETGERLYEVDLIIFALGFEAFTGALDAAGIRNTDGLAPTDQWKRGPRTYLGLTIPGFPNLFTITGAGSPSVLANMFLASEQHIDFVAECIGHMYETGRTTIEPAQEAVRAWTGHAADAAKDLLRLQVDSYLVHVNHDDRDRTLIPYAGGFHHYVQRCRQVVARGYDGFAFG